MKSEAEEKLDKIARIWNNFILIYKFCNQKIKFTEEVKTNYFGDILGYFHDTFDVVFKIKEEESYSERFSNNISLLQAIYIHQDFIEELLLIFKCGITKGDLKKDLNYSINRDLRNELVGHPIRRINGEFISSTTFGYNDDKKYIVYLRYHKDKNFQFEKVSCEIAEIIERHEIFLNTYFDRILDKLKVILTSFAKEVDKIERLLEIKSFEIILNYAAIHFESIFESDFLYDKESLIEVYNRRKDHQRYQNVIDAFCKDLEYSLNETKLTIQELFEPKKITEVAPVEEPIFNIVISVSDELSLEDKKESKVTYHYELGKLATNRSSWGFSFFGDMLKSKCLDNILVLNELNHMKANISNEIEYYSSCRLIRSILKED